MDLTTPALLFPAISLLLLAYTNRFLVIAQLIRQLHVKYQERAHDVVLRQIANLRVRVMLIRRMQEMGVGAFILCALSMFLVFIKLIFIAQIIFGFSIFMLVLSLLVSLYEIVISTKAIEIEMEDMVQSLQEQDKLVSAAARVLKFATRLLLQLPIFINDTDATNLTHSQKRVWRTAGSLLIQALDRLLPRRLLQDQ